VYPFATENIAGYFSKIGFKAKKVLAVASSGDHAINAFAAGAAGVTCFDVNYFARHMMELKLAALRKLDREAFIAFWNSLEFSTYKEFELPVAGRYFWDRAFEYFRGDGASLRASALFKDNHDARPAADKARNALENNPYLASEDAYLAARRVCNGKRVKFVQSDVTGLAAKLDEKYDVILLSNISDYAHHIFAQDCLAQYRERVIAPLSDCLTSEGVLAFGYVYDGMDLHLSKARSPINDAGARALAFPAHEEIRIPSTIDARNHDTVLLLRA
jgi:hypothetical protein